MLRCMYSFPNLQENVRILDLASNSNLNLSIIFSPSLSLKIPNLEIEGNLDIYLVTLNYYSRPFISTMSRIGQLRSLRRVSDYIVTR